MDKASVFPSPMLNTRELEDLKLVKHGIPLDEEMRQRLLDAQCIAHEIGGWALTERGRRWEALG